MQLEELLKIESPKEFFKQLEKSLIYGAVDSTGKTWTDCSIEKFNELFNKDWRTRSPEEIIKSGVGNCYDFTEVERTWFTRHGYNFKTFWVCAYKKDTPGSGFCHAYIAYQSHSGPWCYFELADSTLSGIFHFYSLPELVAFQAQNQLSFAAQNLGTSQNLAFDIHEFSAPKLSLNIFEFMDYASSGPQFTF